MTDEPVMFQGKWIETDDGGTWFVPDEVIEEIRVNPPSAGTLFGMPVIDNREHPGNCHNGATVFDSVARGTIPNRDPNKHHQQCPETKAALENLGLTKNGACPTIRNSRKGK